MAYSSVSYSANSAANSGKDYTYSFPAVAHDTANILVTVGGTALAITRYTVASSGGTITLEAAPGAGTAPIDAVLSASNVLKVYRFTNRTSAEVVFSSTAIIQDEDLNTATDQGRYLALEAVDRANESIAIDETDSTRYNIQVEGVDKRIFGIATPTNDKDAVNKAYADANVAAAASSASDASDSADEAEEWATKVDGYVSGSGNAAKAWAIGGIFVTDTALRGAAKEWATADEDDTVDGTLFSAKHHSAKAADQVGLATTQVGLATTQVGLAADQVTLATAAQVAAANSAAAVSAVYDDFADKYLGQMADGATATSGTANGTWAKNSSSITLASTSGTIEVGQLVAGTGIPAGANILSIDGSTIVITNSMAALGSAVALTFTGHGIYGAYNVAKDGPPTDNDNGTLATGMLYFNSTDNEMRIYDGGNWIAASAAGSNSILEYKFVATASQTTFSGTDANGATLSYTASNLIIFLNGVRLDASDYTASSGTSIVLGSGATVSDELVVVAFKSFTAADTVPASTGGTFSGNVAITGNLSVDTIEQQGSSGIVISDDIKLSSGKAIKNAAGTALLGEDGALGSGVTGVGAWTKLAEVTATDSQDGAVRGGGSSDMLKFGKSPWGETSGIIGLIPTWDDYKMIRITFHDVSFGADNLAFYIRYITSTDTEQSGNDYRYSTNYSIDTNHGTTAVTTSNDNDTQCWLIAGIGYATGNCLSGEIYFPNCPGTAKNQHHWGSLSCQQEATGSGIFTSARFSGMFEQQIAISNIGFYSNSTDFNAGTFIVMGSK